MSNLSREDLQAARNEFEGTLRYPQISVDFGVRRLAFTTRQTAFQSQDLVFTMNFHEIRKEICHLSRPCCLFTLL